MGEAFKDRISIDVDRLKELALPFAYKSRNELFRDLVFDGENKVIGIKSESESKAAIKLLQQYAEISNIEKGAKKPTIESIKEKPDTIISLGDGENASYKSIGPLFHYVIDDYINSSHKRQYVLRYDDLIDKMDFLNVYGELPELSDHGKKAKEKLFDNIHNAIKYHVVATNIEGISVIYGPTDKNMKPLTGYVKEVYLAVYEEAKCIFEAEEREKRGQDIDKKIKLDYRNAIIYKEANKEFNKSMRKLRKKWIDITVYWNYIVSIDFLKYDPPLGDREKLKSDLHANFIKKFKKDIDYDKLQRYYKSVDVNEVISKFYPQDIIKCLKKIDNTYTNIDLKAYISELAAIAKFYGFYL